MIYTNQEISEMSYKDLKRALREFERAWDLDAPLQDNPELLRQADILSNQLNELESWIEAYDLEEAVFTPAGRFRSVREAAIANDLTEPTVYYRLTAEPGFGKLSK